MVGSVTLAGMRMGICVVTTTTVETDGVVVVTKEGSIDMVVFKTRTIGVSRSFIRTGVSNGGREMGTWVV